jgi:NurA-like 5'-3' nuclease
MTNKNKLKHQFKVYYRTILKSGKLSRKVKIDGVEIFPPHPFNLPTNENLEMMRREIVHNYLDHGEIVKKIEYLGIDNKA